VSTFNLKYQKKVRQKLRNNSTEFEIILWSRLKDRQCGNFKFVRQFGVGGYIVDFYCPKKRLAVELDGSQHSAVESQKYDEERSKYIEHLNINVIRFWNNEISQNLEGVLDEILFELNTSPVSS